MNIEENSRNIPETNIPETNIPGTIGKRRVILGMSGGVDSSVAAYLLKEAGYDVIGLTLRTWQSDSGEDSRCCEIEDAAAAARKIGIPHHTLNCLREFEREVTEPFVKEYLRGRTPNPCVGCNRTIKWDRMLYMAKVLGADLIATGHYASVVQMPDGRYTVKTADDAGKDQTYMLYRLTQEQLAHTVMPLGAYTKEQVREIARAAGIPSAEKPDSQEICFVPDGNYAEYIRTHAGQEIPGEGAFTDEEGNRLGTHKGIIHYTVGQRKGLGIALGHPMYVKRIDPVSNEVVLAPDDALYGNVVTCEDLCFMSIPDMEPGECLRADVKIRYRHKAAPAELKMLDGGMLEIRFDRPVRAAAPGQSAVFYDADGCVIGGGIISQRRCT